MATNKQSKYAAKGGPYVYSNDLKLLARMARDGQTDTEEYEQVDARWRKTHGVPPRNAPFSAVVDFVDDSADDDFVIGDLEDY